MTRISLRSYPPEFRAEAVKLVVEQELSLEAAAAAALGSVAELEAGNARLRREIGVGRMEKEVLKKAAPHGVPWAL